MLRPFAAAIRSAPYTSFMSQAIPTDLIVSVSGIRGIVGKGLTPQATTSFAAALGTYLGGGRVVVQTRRRGPRRDDPPSQEQAPLRRRPVVYLPSAQPPAALVIFSHGLGGSREGNAFMGQHWSNGQRSRYTDYTCVIVYTDRCASTYSQVVLVCHSFSGHTQGNHTID